MSDRQQILSDQEFWTRLEYDASRWLEGSEDRALRRFWIDGFNPEVATNTKRGLDVEGAAWVMRSDGGEVAGGVPPHKRHGEGDRSQPYYRFLASIPQKLVNGRRLGFEIESLSLDEGQQFLQIVIGCPKKTAEPGTAPNGGPGTASGNSALTEGPPSVS